MAKKSHKYNREIWNQSINLFWTALCFAPIVWFWIEEGLNLYFYLFLVAACGIGMLPAKILNMLMLSSNRRLYERLGVKQIRKFVQNGDAVRSMVAGQRHLIIKGVSQARQYLHTIAIYERYHWICFTFFLLTTVVCIRNGNWKFGMMITAANILYNVSSILLQQYNKIRIKKITG